MKTGISIRQIEELTSLDRELIYQIALSEKPLSRIELAKRNAVSKMTISRHISALVEQGMITEITERNTEHLIGRTAGGLLLSEQFPCTLGILIKRSYIQMVIADFSGKIVDMTKHYFEHLTAETLEKLLKQQYDELVRKNKRQIIGIGVAAIGPIDVSKGCILRPSDFFDIQNFPVVDIMRRYSNLPVYMLHDASGGALAEKMYGNGRMYKDYMYIHIAEGIGMGLIQHGKLFQSISGQGGEIGHTSIHFQGPKCSCGNYGCLEVYANLQNMRKKIQELLPFVSDTPFKKIKNPTWEEIVACAAKGDMLAIAALDEFCTYLAQAIKNALNLYNFSVLIIGYDSIAASDIVTNLIREKLKKVSENSHREIEVLQSCFDNAPLMGAAAIAANEEFYNHFVETET